jgi:hypothetical protein
MEQLLTQHIPREAISYCLGLWRTNPFTFKTTSNRSTKLGDYRYFPIEKSHTITVNNDLNQYSFLITYIHEVAHRVTFEKYGRKVKPHGLEWKLTFKEIMLPILNSAVFPEDVIKPLAAYLKNPAATTHANIPLLQALRRYNSISDVEINTLSELSIGEQFSFKKRTFEKLQTKRTRVVCRDLISNRNYLISGIAEVNKLDR